VKLTSIEVKKKIRARLAPPESPHQPSHEPTPEPSEHLLCLSTKEALMLFQFLQAALLHPPMREGLMGPSEFSHFHRQLSGALATAVSGRAQPSR
jgi:hypothetical protein